MLIGYEFSLALGGVVFDVDDDAASSPARMKKTVKSGRLLDLVNCIYGRSLSLASSLSCLSSAGDASLVMHSYYERCCYDLPFNNDGRGVRKMAKRSRDCIHS